MRALWIGIMAIMLLGAGRLMAEDTFVLNDGRQIEGSVLRTSGSKVTLRTKTGVATYDVMEFDEETRTEHFEQLETDLIRWRMQEAERIKEAERAKAAAERAAKQPSREPFDASKMAAIFIRVGFLLCLIGSLWLIVQGFAVSPVWGIALIIGNGIAGFAFLVLHTERAKAPVLTWVAGAVLILVSWFAAS